MNATFVRQQKPIHETSEANDSPCQADTDAMHARLRERTRAKRAEDAADQEAAELSYEMAQARAVKKANVAVAAPVIPYVRPSEVAYRAKVEAAAASAKAATDAYRQSEFRFAIANAIKQLERAEAVSPDQSHAINLILLDVKNLAA